MPAGDHYESPQTVLMAVAEDPVLPEPGGSRVADAEFAVVEAARTAKRRWDLLRLDTW